MKKLLLLVAVLLLAFIAVNRQRVFIRDPLATVYRNEIKQSGLQVYINYSNDILLEQDAEPSPYRYILQSWNELPGIPARLTCLHWMACLTDADHAPTLAMGWLGRGAYDPKVSMSNREVSFTAGDGTTFRVRLR